MVSATTWVAFFAFIVIFNITEAHKLDKLMPYLGGVPDGISGLLLQDGIPDRRSGYPLNDGIPDRWQLSGYNYPGFPYGDGIPGPGYPVPLPEPIAVTIPMPEPISVPGYGFQPPPPPPIIIKDDNDRMGKLLPLLLILFSSC